MKRFIFIIENEEQKDLQEFINLMRKGNEFTKKIAEQLQQQYDSYQPRKEN